MFSTLPRSGRVPGGARAGFTSAYRRVLRLARAGTWWRELALIAVLYVGYEFSRGFGDIDVSAAAKNGREILHLEQMWHLAPERVLNEALAHATFFAVLSSYFYSLMHYLVTPAVLIWMYRKHRQQYGPARTALAISTALGLIGYIFLPTAPPRMLQDTGLRDTLADTQNWGWWGGEGSVPRGLGALTNQFAAMPSLHVGWAIWCGVLIALYAQRRWVKILGVAYPLTTTFVVMATGNHYLLDAVAGGITMAAGALLASALSRRSPDAAIAADEPAGELAGELVEPAADDRPSSARVDTDAELLRRFPEHALPLDDSSDARLCRPYR